MIRIILTIVFVILCIAMTVIVLMQEGKTSGLGAISGVAEVEITDVIKRNMVPMIVAYALNVAASYIIFVIL